MNLFSGYICEQHVNSLAILDRDCEGLTLPNPAFGQKIFAISELQPSSWPYDEKNLVMKGCTGSTQHPASRSKISRSAYMHVKKKEI